MLVIGILLIFVSTAVHLRLYLNGLRGARNCLRESWLSFWNRSKQVPDAFKIKLAEDMLHRKMTGVAKTGYTWGAQWLSVMVLFTVGNILLDRPRWMTHAQTAAILGVHLMVILASVTPVITQRMAYLMNGVAHVALMIFIYFASPEYFALTLARGLLWRMLWSGVSASPAQTMLWNVLIGSTNCVYASQHPLATGLTPGGVYLFEAGTSACMSLLVFGIRNWALDTIQKDIDAGNLKIESSACKSLLDMVCDVILELGKDLNILHDSRAFAAMMMRSSGTSNAGMHFCGFLAGQKSDVDSIRNHILAAEVGSTECVGTCRAKLSDTMCNTVDVELFFVRVPLNHEDQRYIVGIREFSDGIPAMRSFSDQIACQEQGHSTGGRRRRSLRKGTPPWSEYISLQTENDQTETGSTQHSPEIRDNSSKSREELSDNESEPVSNGACQQRLAKSQLRFPHLACTQSDAACVELLIVMAGFNLKVLPTQCCPLHAYLLEMQLCIRHLAKQPCNPNFAEVAPDGLQCENCGIFQASDKEAQCFLCDSGKLKQHTRGEVARIVKI